MRLVTKWRIAILATATVAALLLIIQLQRCRYVEVFADDRGITGGDYVTPLSLVNVHESRPHYLYVCGKRYDNVRGIAPFYRYIPEFDAILFVVESNAYDEFVFVGLASCRAVRINVGRSGIGTWLGTPNTPSVREGITVDEPHTATVYSHGPLRSSYVKVDLESGQVLSRWEVENSVTPAPNPESP